jgi:hypothetical protein
LKITGRRLNRATLARQLLLKREALDAVEAVRRSVAIQAQEPASPYLALWNRVAAFDAAALDRAFADGAVLKATLMRITLHAVTASDYPAFHEAMQPSLRAGRLNDRRFKATGLSVEDADDLVSRVREFAVEPRSNAEIEALLTERVGELPDPGPWWALRSFGPFVHAPTGGPWSFGPRPSYIAAPDGERSGDTDAAVRTLLRRYLEGFGPASIPDIAQFSVVYRPPIRAAVDALGDELVRLEGPDGADMWDVPGGSVPEEDTPAPPRLLPMWDSTLLAYADRSRIVPPDYRKLVMRSNGDVLPTLLVDGFVAGVWRPIDDGIEATAFHRLARADWVGLEAEATALREFLAPRDPAVYRRHVRWWANLPAAEVRVLGR